jgi:hypothetical protein
MAGAIDDGTPSGEGSSGGGSSGEGSSGEGSSDGGPRMPLAATVADVGVVPGDMAIITVTLNREPTQNLLFTYTTADGTALAGTYYTGVTSGSAMIAQGQLSTDIAIPTSSSSPGVLYLGKRFVVTLSFATEPTLNHDVTISFSAAPPVTGTHVLKNKWAAFPASSSTPAARAGHSAIWTEKKLIIWGGFSGTVSPYLYYGGAAYDPGTNSWTPISSAGAPSARSSHVAVWTGAKMIVWGGYNESQLWRNDGGAYDPATDTWSALPQNGSIPSQRAAAAGAWDGAKMIVWGGYSGSLGYLNDGAIYDPGNGAWVAIAATNAPSARSGATGVWTGAKMIVWSGAYAAHPTVDGIFNYYNDGAAYNPVANTWTQISSAGAPAARTLSGTAWTGMQMITWAGGDSSVLYGDGGFYNPGANVWNSMSVLHAPANRDFGASVWTGSSFIYWGGYAGRSSATAYLNDGGIYY